MAQPRRMAVDGSKQRELIVEAAAELLREEGYTAISARRVTSKAGLRSQLLYYYFETMDDLILAVARRVTDRRQEQFEAALASSNPLQAIWELNSDPSVAVLSAELISIASHRETIREQVIRTAGEFRAQEVAAVSSLLKQHDGNLDAYPAEALVMIATAIGRTISTEQALGFTHCHKETLALVQRTIARLCGAAPLPPEGKDKA